MRKISRPIRRLKQDLLGDGWSVLTHYVNQTDPPAGVKALIQADYSADPANVRSVFLFGNVPVPYAGPCAPNGHPDHYRPWPADLYYGIMSGQWNMVPAAGGVPAYLNNFAIPADVDLEVGRVDLSQMPIFAPKTESDLLRQYLDKDHNFRHTLVTAARRALLTDRFGYGSFLGGETLPSAATTPLPPCSVPPMSLTISGSPPQTKTIPFPCCKTTASCARICAAPAKWKAFPAPALPSTGPPATPRPCS